MWAVYDQGVTEQEEQNERIRKLSERAWLSIACLAVTVLVLVISFGLLVGVASSSQADETRLSVELECRSLVAANFDFTRADLSVLIAEGLVAVSRGEPVDGDAIAAQAELLEEVATSGRTAFEKCKQP